MEEVQALVIGGGPAGLMAAETLARTGVRVVLAEAMPTAGRKFLMAGRSALNLSFDAPPEQFLAAYNQGRCLITPMIAEFGPGEVAGWARGLGQEVFTGSSGRIFPCAMKASPLLRAWLARLEDMGVQIRRRWRWLGWQGDAARFATPGGEAGIRAGVTVLALGGGSWARLGSNGAWVKALEGAGVQVAPFQPSNVGFGVNWSAHMARHFGAPVKPARLSAGGRSVPGEFVITSRGVEGGGIYALGPELRTGAQLRLDLMPDVSERQIAGRLARPRGKATLANHLRKTLGLAPVKIALLRELASQALGDPKAIAGALKSLEMPLAGPHPIDEAISTAGGVMAAALDQGLMLRARAGVFCAGEMLDWDAPTGGWLITACLATGRHAGRAAAKRLGT